MENELRRNTINSNRLNTDNFKRVEDVIKGSCNQIFDNICMLNGKLT